MEQLPYSTLVPGEVAPRLHLIPGRCDLSSTDVRLSKKNCCVIAQ